MQLIETFEHFEQALEKLVTAHTHMDRKDVADAIALVVAGHPREAAIKLLLDGLCSGSNNHAGRLAAADEIKRLTMEFEYVPDPPAAVPAEGDTKADPETAASLDAALEASREAARAAAASEGEQPDPNTETVHYADGSSATGPAPLPRVSPDGAPAVEPPAPEPEKKRLVDRLIDAIGG